MVAPAQEAGTLNVKALATSLRTAVVGNCMCRLETIFLWYDAFRDEPKSAQDAP